MLGELVNNFVLTVSRKLFYRGKNDTICPCGVLTNSLLNLQVLYRNNKYNLVIKLSSKPIVFFFHNLELIRMYTDNMTIRAMCFNIFETAFGSGFV